MALVRLLWLLASTYLCLLSNLVVLGASQIDPYKVLNVPKHATHKEIRKAFKTLALKYHPDRNTPASDEEKMKKINNAFEILGDEAKRKKYDDAQRQNSIFSGRGFHRSASTSDGIGASLTTHNYFNLLYNIHDLPWLILAYEDFSQSCKQAKAIFEEACIKLEGLARCAKVDVNKESSLINEFGLRRVPHFVVHYQWKGKALQEHLTWKGRDRVNVGRLIDFVATIFPTKCQVFTSSNQMMTFLDDTPFDDDHFNSVKAVVFSNAKKRQSPHILLQYIATAFQDSMELGYVHLDTDRGTKDQRQMAAVMASQLGLEADELEPPSMYILRSPLIHRKLLESSKEGLGSLTLDTLEDVGIYHIALSSDVDSMTMFVEQYSVPLIPKMDGEQYLERCFLSDSLDKIDEEKICYLLLLQNEEQNMVEKALMFGQYVLGSLDESVQFGWINCEQQKDFCDSMKKKKPNGPNAKGVSEGNEGGIQIVAIKAFQDHYHLFNEGQNVGLKEDDVKSVVRWINVLERDDMVFGATCSDENETGKCIEEEQGEIKWKEGLLFPMMIQSPSDSWDGVLGVLGVFGSGVSSTVGTVSSIVSSLFQGFFVLIIFMIILPMLRMAR